MAWAVLAAYTLQMRRPRSKLIRTTSLSLGPNADAVGAVGELDGERGGVLPPKIEPLDGGGVWTIWLTTASVPVTVALMPGRQSSLGT